MPIPLTLELLPTLTDGQLVRYRLGCHTSGPAPQWGPWDRGNLYLFRRPTDLPANLRSRSRCPNAGDILTLTIRDPYTGTAEFSQDGFDPQTGTWNTEEYLLEFALLSHPEVMQGVAPAPPPARGPMSGPGRQHPRFAQWRRRNPQAQMNPPETEAEIMARLVQAARTHPDDVQPRSRHTPAQQAAILSDPRVQQLRDGTLPPMDANTRAKCWDGHPNPPPGVFSGHGPEDREEP